MSDTTCKNCGGDEGLHHYKTGQCPVGGREAPVGRKQEWKTTTFEPVSDEVTQLRSEREAARAEVARLNQRVAELESIARMIIDADDSDPSDWPTSLATPVLKLHDLMENVTAELATLTPRGQW